MTELFKGEIIRLHHKETPPDRFDNTFKNSMQVRLESGEEVWVDLGAKKKPGLTQKRGEKWVEVGAGSKIAVVVESREYNGKTYYNAKSGDVKVMELVSPEASPSGPTRNSSSGSPGSQTATASSSPARSGGTGPDWAAKDAGAAASASIDKALAYFAIDGTLPTNDILLDKARAMQFLVKTLAAEIQGGGAVKQEAPAKPAAKEAPAATRKPAAKKAPEPEPEDSWVDDDIPF